MNNVLVIGGGKYQLSGIKRLIEKDYSVILVDRDIQCPGKEVANTFLHLDTKDVKSIVEYIDKNKIKIKSCLCFATEYGLRTVAEINEKFNLPGLKLKDIEIATSKLNQRKVMNKSGLPTPNYIALSKESINKEINSNSFNYPVIVKPIDGAGSRGVFLVRDKEELSTTVHKSMLNSIFDSKIIIEELINGIEFTVESLVYNNEIHTLGISEKKKPLNNFTVSTELFYNSPLSMDLKTKITERVNKFLFECNFNNTILHTEVIYSFKDKDIYIVETTTRSGGFGIFDKILPHVTDVDIVDITIDLLLGKEIPAFVVKDYPCILRFFSANEGKLLDVYQNENIIKSLNQIEYELFVEKGDFIGETDSDGARIGYLISFGKSWESVFEKANKLDYAVKFEVNK